MFSSELDRRSREAPRHPAPPHPSEHPTPAAEMALAQKSTMRLQSAKAPRVRRSWRSRASSPTRHRSSTATAAAAQPEESIAEALAIGAHRRCSAERSGVLLLPAARMMRSAGRSPQAPAGAATRRRRDGVCTRRRWPAARPWWCARTRATWARPPTWWVPARARSGARNSGRKERVRRAVANAARARRRRACDGGGTSGCVGAAKLREVCVARECSASSSSTASRGAPQSWHAR